MSKKIIAIGKCNVVKAEGGKVGNFNVSIRATEFKSNCSMLIPVDLIEYVGPYKAWHEKFGRYVTAITKTSGEILLVNEDVREIFTRLDSAKKI